MKPTIKRGPASRYESPNESIYEFSNGRGVGGLISLRIINGEDGSTEALVVDLYRCDKEVRIVTPTKAET
jgi:hypothetical protein